MFVLVSLRVRNSGQTPKCLQSGTKETTRHGQAVLTGTGLWCRPFPPGMHGSRTSQSRGSAGERETPKAQEALSHYFAISFALGSGPDLPVVLVSMMEKRTACVGKRLRVDIVIAPSQNRLVWHTECNTHMLRVTISGIWMRKTSYWGCEHSSEAWVTPTKRALLMLEVLNEGRAGKTDTSSTQKLRLVN